MPFSPRCRSAQDAARPDTCRFRQDVPLIPRQCRSAQNSAALSKTVERSFGWLSRFSRLGRDLERLQSTLVGFHFVAFCILLANKLPTLTTNPYSAPSKSNLIVIHVVL